MKVDVYKNGRKYLLVPEGTNVAELPADIDPELREISSRHRPWQSSLDIRFGFSAVQGDASELADFDPADIARQIEAKGYATQTAVPTDTMIPPKPAKR
jgi:hypothetical protein